MAASGEPVLIADGVWWVGMRLANDTFQCHAYLIDNGDQSILIDPGSPLTIHETLAKVDQVSSVDSIRYLVCHHPDPDIAAALPYLSDRLTRPDVLVVTEWRAQALIKHYGHRFGYYLVEEHGWRIPLGPGRDLEFQLTPYLHFPGAMVSYDTGSRTLFSSDLFGGFVPESAVLRTSDAAYIIDHAKPFHQHYMPSRQLLSAGLARIERRWPDIETIAPQHGHVIDSAAVHPVFDALKRLECGVFTLADADVDLKRLLRISEARARITDALLSIVDPFTLVSAINAILAATHEARDCALYIDIPEDGWTMWASGFARPILRAPDEDASVIDLPGVPAAVLTIHGVGADEPDDDLMEMLHDMAPTMRGTINVFAARVQGERDARRAHQAARTDPLTGLANRRALDEGRPSGDYALISVDVDRFKSVNDTLGHAAGDRVLCALGDVLTRFIRGYDTAYRIGGDEFVLVLPDCGRTPATRIAERILAAFGQVEVPGPLPGGPPSLSIGVTVANRRVAAEFGEELGRADAAMYEAKGRGGGQVHVAEDGSRER